MHILVPTGASGIMIGRQGSVIKGLSERSNCRIKLGDVADPYDTKERILIVKGNNIQDIITVCKCQIGQLML